MITIRRLCSESQRDHASVLRIVLEAPSSGALQTVRAPSAEAVENFFWGDPPSADPSKKSIFGLFAGPEMIGCGTVIRSHPSHDSAFIGLLLIAEQHQGQGHGKTALLFIDSAAHEWGCSKLQIAAVAANLRGIAFWQREGFTERFRVADGQSFGDFVVMERAVRPLSSSIPSDIVPHRAPMR